jgi:DNA-binding NtrC family response regulator
MSIESPTILFVDDDADIQKAARLLLERRGMRMLSAGDPDAAWAILAEHAIDIVLLDLNFSRGRTSGEEGFAMLRRVLAADRDAVVIVVTGHSGINIAVEAMRAGASDFVIKPWSNDKLVAAIDRAITLRRAKLATGQGITADADRLILGDDPAIERLRGVIERIAPTDAPVLITGPAGSGKSLVARAVHHGSSRGARPLVVVPAATLDTSDAIAASLLPAREATLVIDDVEDVPRRVQTALAGALDEVRVIATSRLDRMSLRDALHADLLFRVNTVELVIPPLARRATDAVILARHFLDRFAERHGRALRPLAEDAVAWINGQSWPDDVRGLRQAMERAVLLGGDGETIGIADLARDPADARPIVATGSDLNLERSERVLVEAALKRHAFNVSRAATELGLTRTALYRRMAKYGL